MTGFVPWILSNSDPANAVLLVAIWARLEERVRSISKRIERLRTEGSP